ncbi:MAG: peptidoglycan-binding domain-containing protein [Acidimicrobiales bacterium]
MDTVVARQFQVQYGLLGDGIVGPVSWCRLLSDNTQP